MFCRQLFIALSGLLAVATAVAGPILKSVDREGRITYSQIPPPGAIKIEEIDIAPLPTEDAVREAEERLEELKAATAELERERKAREQERARQEAEARARQTAVLPPPVYVPVPVPVFAGRPPFREPHPPRRPPHRDHDRPIDPPRTIPH